MTMDNTTPGRAVLYLRLSQDKKKTEDDLDPTSIAAQRKLCTAWAKARGWTLRAERPEYVDIKPITDGSTGPEFAQMMADVQAGLIDGIIAKDTDRLVRDLGALGHMIKTLNKHNVRCATTSGDLDLGSPSGQLLANLMTSVSAYEMSHKSARQIATAQESRDRGEVYMRQRPFGWTDSTMKTLDQRESEGIRLAHEMIIAGATLGEVAEAWNDAGIPTTRGSHWSRRTVHHTLDRPPLGGIVIYKNREYRDIKPAFPSPLTRDEYDHMRAVLSGRRLRVIEKSRAPKRSPLAGLVKCECGQPMYRGDATFLCASDSCGAAITTKILESKLERYVLYAVTCLKPKDVLDPAQAKRHKQITSSLAELEAERQKVLDAGLSVLIEATALEKLHKAAQALLTELAHVTANNAVAALVAELVSAKTFEQSVAELMSREDRFRSMTLAQQRTVYDFLGSYRVRFTHRPNVMGEDRIEITPKLPLPEHHKEFELY